MIEFMQKVKEQSSECVFDMLSCDMNTQEFIDEVQRVEEELGVDIRYSLDATGNPSYGDWVLESDNVEVKSLYFNDTIEQWNGILGALTPANTAVLTLDGTTYKLTGDLNISARNDYIEFSAGSGADSFDGQGYKITLTGAARTSATGIFSASQWKGFILRMLIFRVIPIQQQEV